MSVTMTKADGVTVFTLTSDPNSACPPLCQIFKGLCYSPVCCSVSQHLRRLQGTSQSVMGALQIMVGILNIGLGAVMYASGRSYLFYREFPFWFGTLFIVFGIMRIICERFLSPCLVVVNVILILAEGGFAITAIVLYTINLSMGLTMVQGAELVNTLLKGMNITLIVLSLLALGIVVTTIVSGIDATCNRENEDTEDPELYKALPEDVTSNPTV